MTTRRRRRVMAQMNVVPYIDVMMVLLVIFMVTAPMMTPGVVNLPSVARSRQVPQEPLQVTIHADGRLDVRDVSHGAEDQSVGMTDLADLVRSRQADHPDQPVVIAADKNVRYDVVMKVMSLLQQNQVQRIGLLTVPEQHHP